MNLLKKITTLILWGFSTFSLANVASGCDVHIAFVSDENYPMPVCVAMASMIKQSSSLERLHFHIVDLGIKPIDKERIENLKSLGDFSLEFIPFDKQRVAKFQSYFWSTAIYAKLLLGDLLPSISKCILIDGDTIAAKNMRILYDIDIGDNYIAIMNNYSFTNAAHGYCCWLQRVNAGSMLMNLDLMRRDGIKAKLMTCLSVGQQNLSRLPIEDGIRRTFTEEHTFQEVCVGRIFDLPPRFNFLNYMIYPEYDGEVSESLRANAEDPQANYILDELENAVVYHYSDIPKIWYIKNESEWIEKKRSKYMRDLWYHYFAMTQYAGKSL